MGDVSFTEIYNENDIALSVLPTDTPDDSTGLDSQTFEVGTAYPINFEPSSKNGFPFAAIRHNNHYLIEDYACAIEF